MLSSILFLSPRGVEQWQLVGLITRRSQVRVLPPLPKLLFRSYVNYLVLLEIMGSIDKRELILIYILVLLIFAFMTSYATGVINEANFQKQQGIVSTQQT